MPGIDLGSDAELGSGSRGKGPRRAGPCLRGAYNLAASPDLGEGKGLERSSDAAEACGYLDLLLRYFSLGSSISIAWELARNATETMPYRL